MLITKPVEAFVGPIEVRLFEYETTQVGVDDTDERPWAWLAFCRVKLRIEGLTCTKKLVGRYAYRDQLGWPVYARPSEPDLQAGFSSVLEQVKAGLDRLGLPTDAEIIVHTPPPGAQP